MKILCVLHSYCFVGGKGIILKRKEPMKIFICKYPKFNF